LADIIKKLSYTLTRGAACLELASDVPHEVNYTQGKELRYIAGRQGLDITFHGSLTIAMCIPERTEWEIAQDHMQKSIKSAVHAGAKYVDFHSCLREWLELFTYAGSKLEIVMCDYKGRFIKDLFADTDDPKHNQAAEKLREWFVNEYREEGGKGSVKNFVEELGSTIIGHDTSNALFHSSRDEIYNDFYKQKLEKRLPEELKEIERRIQNEIEEEFRKIDESERLTEEQKTLFKKERRKQIEGQKDQLIERSMRNLRIEARNEDLEPGEAKELSVKTSEKFKELMRKEVIDHLKAGKNWFRVERAGTLEYAYRIIAHYLFFSKDKIWQDMINMYKDEFGVDEELKYDENDDQWLEKSLARLENMSNSKRRLIITFKEFYYSVVAAKFLQGHLEELVHWMEGELPEILESEVDLTESRKDKRADQKKNLKKVLDELCIAIENPDSRNPEHGGRFLLWRPKQIYVAIKNIRESLKGNHKHWDKVLMLVDFEHLATQGVDPLEELTKMKDNPLTKDYAKLIKAVHAGVPTPLHSHKPIKAADRLIVYTLLWRLREAGLGSEHLTYLIFERGGFKQPYASSVRVLKLFAKLMKEGTSPENVPDAFFVISKPAYKSRQKAIIFDHTFDPIKGLLKFPEEEYTLLGTAALKSGKKPEEWKKEELR